MSDHLSLEALIAQRYPVREYALFFEIRDSTGWAGKGNRADALAMSLWPSRGLGLTGFEVKTHRSDWLRELGDPAKSAVIQKFCHFWYLVTEPDLVKEGELPRTWGLLERASPKKLKVVKEAPALKAKALSPQFIASMLRNASEGAERKAKQLADAMAEATREQAKSAEEGRLKNARAQLEAQMQYLKEFETAARISLTNPHWHGNQPQAIGMAVRVVLDADEYANFKRRLEAMHIESKAMADKTKQALDEISVMDHQGKVA